MMKFFELGWTLYQRHGEITYRVMAMDTVVRHYRRRPSRYLAGLEVRWGYDEPFRRFVEAEQSINDNVTDNERRLEKLGALAFETDRVLERLPAKIYLASGTIGSPPTRPTFELVEPVVEAHLNTYGGGTTRTVVSAEERMRARVNQRRRDGWNMMLVSSSTRWFKPIGPWLMNQMMFDKMAASEWPVPPREPAK